MHTLEQNRHRFRRALHYQEHKLNNSSPLLFNHLQRCSFFKWKDVHCLDTWSHCLLRKHFGYLTEKKKKKNSFLPYTNVFGNESSSKRIYMLASLFPSLNSSFCTQQFNFISLLSNKRRNKIHMKQRRKKTHLNVRIKQTESSQLSSRSHCQRQELANSLENETRT